MTKRILICGNSGCDFTELFNNHTNISCSFIDFDYLLSCDINEYDAFVILGYSHGFSYSFSIQEKLNQITKAGKPSLIQVLPGICGVADTEPVSTRFMRLVYTGSLEMTKSIEKGDLLDDQNNIYYPAVPGSNSIPLLVYKDKVMAHNKFKGNLKFTPAEYALWKENSVIYCTFDISNFAKARFSPISKWQAIIEYIFAHITASDLNQNIPTGYSNIFTNQSSTGSLDKCFENALNWFTAADILIENGKKGVYEGFATEIDSDGCQKKAVEIRNDCCGEVMFTYFIDSMLNNNSESEAISDNISDFIFSEMFINQPGGLLHGMMKWSLKSAHICYQDDVARAIIPQMLKCRYSGTDAYLAECTEALEFLYKTTGTDGLRRNRTENQNLNVEEISHLSSRPAENPSAHYTGYYSGALLLNYTITGNEKFRDMGIKGLESIMEAYPDTKRCQSETQELCRLILPLALLYEATGQKEHNDMLYKVVNDLKRFHHESGAYLEWDTGYQSRYSRTTSDECSILTENGDPVADFLYTINWLPFNFIQAYFITKDELFHELWASISEFMMNSQIISGNSDVNGAWARGWDVELNEIFALPNDVGWGPWCIESGWTVAEIASGIGMGLLKDKLLKFY